MPSFEMISSLVVQVFILIFASILYVFFVSFVFPSLFLKPKYNHSLEDDRGLKKYRFQGGCAIVYEPTVEVKRYIKQYILTAMGDGKYIQCKFDFRVFSSKYEVFAFNCDGSMIDVIQIEEPILENNNYITTPAQLPADTAYVRVSVKSVNDVKIERDPMLSIPSSRIAQFTLFTVLLTIVEAFVMKFVLLGVADELFSYTSRVDDAGNFFTLIFAILTGFCISYFGKLLHGLGKREKEDLKNQKNRSNKSIRK